MKLPQSARKHFARDQLTDAGVVRAVEEAVLAAPPGPDMMRLRHRSERPSPAKTIRTYWAADLHKRPASEHAGTPRDHSAGCGSGPTGPTFAAGGEMASPFTNFDYRRPSQPSVTRS